MLGAQEGTPTFRIPSGPFEIRNGCFCMLKFLYILSAIAFGIPACFLVLCFSLWHISNFFFLLRSKLQCSAIAWGIPCFLPVCILSVPVLGFACACRGSSFFKGVPVSILFNSGLKCYSVLHPTCPMVFLLTCCGSAYRCLNMDWKCCSLLAISSSCFLTS